MAIEKADARKDQKKKKPEEKEERREKRKKKRGTVSYRLGSIFSMHDFSAGAEHLDSLHFGNDNLHDGEGG